MVSYTHESLIDIFRRCLNPATNLLLELDVELPESDEIRHASSDLSDLRPAEYHADLVLFLVRESREVMGVIVEVQLALDEDKLYAWPAYLANLRARHRCPVCLLVFTKEEKVARWAAKPIELGPGARRAPFVIGPGNTPIIVDLEEARRNVGLAVLSAVAHGGDSDITLVERIARVATEALEGIEPEPAGVYFDLILISVPEEVRKSLEGTMNSLSYKYQSDFARRYFGEGKAEGRAEGKAEGKIEAGLAIVTKLLTARFGPLPNADQMRLSNAQAPQLDVIAERILTAQTLEEALRPLFE